MIHMMTGTENFDKALQEGDMIAGFTAPWCGYCRRLKPMIEKLAGEIEVPIYSINCDDDEELAKRYEVETIPELIYFKNGQPTGRIVGYGNVGYPELKAFVAENQK